MEKIVKPVSGFLALLLALLSLGFGIYALTKIQEGNLWTLLVEFSCSYSAFSCSRVS